MEPKNLMVTRKDGFSLVGEGPPITDGPQAAVDNTLGSGRSGKPERKILGLWSVDANRLRRAPTEEGGPEEAADRSRKLRSILLYPIDTWMVSKTALLDIRNLVKR